VTKEELKNEILDQMTNEYYGSNLCQIIDCNEMMDSFSKASLEGAVYELLEELSDNVIKTMEENGVLREKQSTPV